MKLRNLVPAAVIAATALCAFVAPSSAQGEEEPILETVPVLQGGFYYLDKRNKGDKYDLNNMTMWSDGQEMLTGGRVRVESSASGALTCFDIVWFDGGMDKARRTDKKLKYKQRNYVDITFVQFNCSGVNPGVPVCYQFTSNTVETPKCKSGSDTNAKQTLKKALPPVGKSKFNCTDGVEITSEAFGLPEGIQDNFLEAYPDLREELKANFSDDAGTIIDEALVVKNLSPTLGLASCF